METKKLFVTLNKRQTWVKGIPLPFYTAKGLPFWKKFKEKNWRPSCLFCKQAIFNTDEEYNQHYTENHLDGN